VTGKDELTQKIIAFALQVAPVMELDFIDRGGKLIEELVRLSNRNP